MPECSEGSYWGNLSVEIYPCNYQQANHSHSSIGAFSYTLWALSHEIPIQLPVPPYIQYL